MPKFLKLNLQFFAEGGDNSDDNQNGDNNNADNQQQSSGKTFTQAELDAMIQKRLDKQANSLKSQWEQELETKQKQEKMTAEDLAKAAQKEAEEKLSKAVIEANNKVKNAEAKALSIELGVKPEKVSYLLKLADLESVEIDEGGAIDQESLKASIEAVLKDLPELKGTTANNGGGNFNGAGGGQKKPSNLSEALAQRFGG
jgi:hypothetical protein